MPLARRISLALLVLRLALATGILVLVFFKIAGSSGEC